MSQDSPISPSLSHSLFSSKAKRGNPRTSPSQLSNSDSAALQLPFCPRVYFQLLPLATQPTLSTSIAVSLSLSLSYIITIYVYIYIYNIYTCVYIYLSIYIYNNINIYNIVVLVSLCHELKQLTRPPYYRKSVKISLSFSAQLVLRSISCSCSYLCCAMENSM